MRRVLTAFCILVATTAPCQAQGDKPNTLTPKEIADGWILLFDGETTFGWKSITFKEKEVPALHTEKGVLHIGGKGRTSDIEFTTRFGSCELSFEYQTEGGNREDVSMFFHDPASGRPTAVGHRAAGYPLHPTKKGEWVTMVSKYAFDLPKETFLVRIEYRDEAGKLLDNHLSGTNGARLQPITLRWITKNTGVKVRNFKLRQTEPESLFNGKDLTGWREFPGKKSKFAVIDNAINVKDGPGDLQTVGKYQNFVLQLECISNGKHLNSGIFFRCRDNEYQNGYETQIRNQFTPEATQEYVIEEYDPKTNMLVEKRKIKSTAFDYGTGAIYRRVPARKEMSKDGEWFGMTIVAHGNHLATWVNGVQVADWYDNRPKSDNARTGCKLEAGHISIQGHDPTTNLSFRNLRITELPSGK